MYSNADIRSAVLFLLRSLLAMMLMSQLRKAVRLQPRLVAELIDRLQFCDSSNPHALNVTLVLC